MTAPIPRLPVLGWSAFSGARSASVPGVLDARNRRYTISGRAAIALALRVLRVQPGHRVLVPTYHCPTMVAPVVQAAAVPMFYPINAAGGPSLPWLEQADLTNVHAMLATHFFGLPQPMAEVRRFCMQHGIALIEDCAHAFFGTSDARPVGTWGHVAIASLTKFFPVPEGGLIVSDSHTLQELELDRRGFLGELKAAADAVELGVRHGRFSGMNPALSALFAIKNRMRSRKGPPVHSAYGGAGNGNGLAPRAAAQLLSSTRPAAAVRWIVNNVHRARIVELRRRNYLHLAERLSSLPGGRPLQPQLPTAAAPYVFPYLVDDPGSSYLPLREAGVPIFRWDAVWDGTPDIPGDYGRGWTAHVFQLGCHQDLSLDDLDRVVEIVRATVKPVQPQVRTDALCRSA